DASPVRHRSAGFSCRPVARPKKNPDLVAEERKITLQDQCRRNAVEGKIGQGKRRFGLGLICTKLAEISELGLT
ncbi:MAG: IS5/IS1182 family transposase, partial [Aphanocapsa feldmannii 288cV]